MRHIEACMILIAVLLAGCVQRSDSSSQQPLQQQYEEQLKRADKNLEKAEEQQQRFDKILTKWEEQAKRYDALLDKWEKQKPTQ